MSIIYLRPNGRRPVWLGVRPVVRDMQADIPRNWCANCGKEVFPAEHRLCPDCALRKEKLYGNSC